MSHHHNSKHRIAWVITIAICVALGTLASAMFEWGKKEPVQACTMDARVCPDGSYVGRSGPMCEFEECPKIVVSEVDTSGWKTFIDAKTGIRFKYPATLSTKYINTADWPPKVQIITGPLSCNEVGDANAQAGRTESKTINARSYCVTSVSQGAAGSTYTDYAYSREVKGKIMYFTFAIRAPNCGNYNDPEKSACEEERKNFNVDKLIDDIIQTTTL